MPRMFGATVPAGIAILYILCLALFPINGEAGLELALSTPISTGPILRCVVELFRLLRWPLFVIQTMVLVVPGGVCRQQRRCAR